MRRFLYLEPYSTNYPATRWHYVASLNVDDVTRNQLIHGQLAELRVARDLGRNHHHLLQRGDAGGGFPLLVQPEERIEQGEDDQEDAGQQLIGDEQADDARHQEDDLHRVSVLAQECLPARLLLFLGKLIEAEALASLRRLFGAQAAIGIDVLRLERVPRAHGVERRLLRGGRLCRCFCDGHDQRPPAFFLPFFVFPWRLPPRLSASSSRRAVSSDAFVSELAVG